MTGLQRRTVRNVFNGTANPKSVLLVKRSLSKLLGKKINVQDIVSGEYSINPVVKQLTTKKLNIKSVNSLREVFENSLSSPGDLCVSSSGVFDGICDDLHFLL